MDRADLIRNIYYQELGRVNPDEEGLNYWLDAGKDLDDSQLRGTIRHSAGLTGKSVHEPLMADQTYAAYLNKMQFNESQIQSSLQAAQEAAQRRIEGQAGSYDLQRRQASRNTNQAYEGRGMYRSGGRLNAVHEGRASIDRNQMQFQQGIGDENAAAERTAATQIAELRRNRADQEIAARDRLTQRSYQP